MPTDTSTGVSAPASEDYWRKIAYKERTRADDNLRLAAERANAIQELKDQLTEANEEIERLKKLLSAAKHGLASYVYGNQSPEFAHEILKYLEGGE